MLLLLMVVWELSSALFSFISSPEPIIWAGALAGQGFYSGGRLVANAVANSGLNGGTFNLLQRAQSH